MEKECKHCKQTIQINKQQQFGAHVRNCKFNPNVNIKNPEQSSGFYLMREWEMLDHVNQIMSLVSHDFRLFYSIPQCLF